MAGPASAVITEQVRQASDVVDVVSSYLTLKRAGRSFKALCPFHREKTPSFHVDPGRQTFKCFGCGVGGDVFKFIQLRENVDFLEARAILANRAGISLQATQQPSSQPQGPRKLDIERANRWARKWFRQQLESPAGHAARQYVLSRGISHPSLERFAIGYAPPSYDALTVAAGRAGLSKELLLAAGLTKEGADGSVYNTFRNRLIFPIQDVMKQTVGFGGRTLGDDPAKYLNTAQNVLFDKRRCLYGLNNATEAFRDGRTAVVVEGYTDCIMAHQYGFGHSVATLGTALTVEHVRMLRRYVDSVILVFDSDEAGQRAADQSLQLFLSEQLDVRLAKVPEEKDPAQWLQEAGSEAFERVLTSAIDALEFKWRQVVCLHRGDGTGPGRRRAIEAFIGLIAHSTDLATCEPIQRGLILNQVGKLLGLPSEEVQRQLRISARRTGPVREAGEPRPPEQVPQMLDAASAAMRDLLEVLLNEPSYYGSIASEFAPSLIADRGTREIAQAVAELAEGGADFTLPELISRFESVEAARRIMALQTSGERRGNFAATIEGAVQCLQRLREHRRIGELETALRRGVEGAGETPEDAPGNQPDGAAMDDESLGRALSQGTRRLHHFAARRHLSSLATTTDAQAVASQAAE